MKKVNFCMTSLMNEKTKKTRTNKLIEKLSNTFGQLINEERQFGQILCRRMMTKLTNFSNNQVLFLGIQNSLPKNPCFGPHIFAHLIFCELKIAQKEVNSLAICQTMKFAINS